MLTGVRMQTHAPCGKPLVVVSITWNLSGTSLESSSADSAMSLLEKDPSSGDILSKFYQIECGTSVQQPPVSCNLSDLRVNPSRSVRRRLDVIFKLIWCNVVVVCLLLEQRGDSPKQTEVQIIALRMQSRKR